MIKLLEFRGLLRLNAGRFVSKDFSFRDVSFRDVSRLLIMCYYVVN